MNEIDVRLINMLKASEGFRSHIYDDGLGTPTIGYGFTKPALDNIDKTLWDRYSRDGISEKEASAILSKMTFKYAEDFKVIPNWDKLNKHQKETLIAIGHNRPYLHTGKTDPKLYKALEEGRLDDVPLYMDWGLSNSKIAKGMKNRWNRFIHLYKTGNYNTTNEGVPDYISQNKTTTKIKRSDKSKLLPQISSPKVSINAPRIPEGYSIEDAINSLGFTTKPIKYSFGNIPKAQPTTSKLKEIYDTVDRNTFKDGGIMGTIGSIASGLSGVLGASINNASIKDTSQLEYELKKPIQTHQDNKSLLDSWGSSYDIAPVSYNQVGNSFGQSMFNTLSSTASGALGGSPFGTVGSVIGGAVGLLGGITGALIGDSRARNKQSSLNQSIQDYNRNKVSSFINQASDIERINDLDLYKQFYGLGGLLI